MAAHDAFYTLPDSLLSFILSKIPIKDAVKSSILSKRWRFIYTQMPELTFSPDLVLGSDRPSLNPPLVSSAENIISNILLLHSHNLEALHLHNTGFDHNQRRFSRESVCKWVEFASLCNIQHLTLFDHYVPGPYNERVDERHRALKETPPPALFSCSRLVALSLHDYILTSVPINFVGFPRLITCRLQGVQLTEESLISFISLCPLLQKLEIIIDDWLGNVVIFSSTIEHLLMQRVKSLSVNCPKLKIMSGMMLEDLSVNGVRLYELSSAFWHLEMDCGSTLRELSMQFCLGDVSASRFLHIVGNCYSLKELVIYLGHSVEREVEIDAPLLNLFHRLPNLQRLHIVGCFVQELARDPIPDCLASPHVNLKKIRVEVLELDYKEIAVISCLLQSIPSLETMEIRLPDEYDEGRCISDYGELHAQVFNAAEGRNGVNGHYEQVQE
ncbi:FBD-associated F-box protein At5g38590 isoform X1 [Cryptomeria japonica]|uniref:FBD-associated F-box protein At5g38590 isoform X1 n=1 Tax=Cryptomeria japonica TaxID=3369 RepID=UPI0027D9DB13|nr:FBD-associated F-box protein At5g38590 isoform X1 [Cryptomeria japonica]